MASKIFINYRRDDSIGTAGRLHDRLAQAFDRKNLFMDIDHIPAGVDFVEYLNTQLADCDVFLAVIGPNWLDAKNDDGGRRLHDPGDFVAIEISTALARTIRVIPVLIDGARIPDASELPEALKPLARRQAITLRHAHFRRDAEALIEKVREAQDAETLRPGRRSALIATAAALFLAGWIGLIQLGIQVWVPWSPQPRPIKSDIAIRPDAAPAIAVPDCPNDYRALDADSPPRECTCSAEATRQGSVYGMEVYPSLSTVCRAALHAGVIGKNGGQVTVIAEPGRASYPGVTRNGVQSGNWGEFKNSFRFATNAANEQAAGRDPALAVAPGSGQSFRDRLANGQPCALCPEMVVVPSGTFTMGSPASEPERLSNETQLRAAIGRPFAVGKFAVTFDEWDACVADGGCIGYRPGDQGWGRGKHPVINLNWDDAKTFVAWLSDRTGRTYRLLSEVEREYATRAGTTTPFWWGSSITPQQANYNGNLIYASGAKGEDRQRTVPVDSFEPNPWGLYNVHGNIWEWTEDCWNDLNNGQPGNGNARTSGDCDRRVVRGGAWNRDPRHLRSAYRFWYSTAFRDRVLGFRVARTLDP